MLLYSTMRKNTKYVFVVKLKNKSSSEEVRSTSSIKYKMEQGYTLHSYAASKTKIAALHAINIKLRRIHKLVGRGVVTYKLKSHRSQS